MASSYDPNLFDNVRLECFDIPLDRSGMKATATSSLPGDYEAGNVLDGDLKTIWHSANTSSNPLPQSITIDLGKSYDVKQIDYVPRPEGINGIITEYNLYTSLDGKDFKLLASGKWEGTAATKHVDFPSTKAAFIKVEATSGINGFASAAEVNIYR